MFGFPPIPVYPANYDSDFTLFKVYNTSEAQTTADTAAWSDEIPVRPRKALETEIWADNGYATISGELFYYDAVRKNDNDRVCCLKRCIRQVGGRPSQVNPIGTWVRGFVVAEHHNQLATATLLAESFIGENFSDDVATLDWRIRHLSDSPFLVDDLCPDVDFIYEIISSSPFAGTVIQYSITIRGNASFNLQFGDGAFTTSQKNGTHSYAPAATIAPILILEGRDCQLVVSPVLLSREDSISLLDGTINVPLPPTTNPPPFTIDIPVPPEIPPTVIPSVVVPGPNLTIPPIVLPKIRSFPSPTGNIPSRIVVGPIPSQIEFFPPINIPSRIFGPSIIVPSQITFQNAPSMIMFGPAPPIPPIQIAPVAFPPIQVEPLKSDIPSIIKLESVNLNGIERAISAMQFPSVIDVQLVSFQNGHSQISIITALQFDALPKLELDVQSIRTAFTQVRHEFRKLVKIKMPKVPDIKVDWGQTPTLTAVLKLEMPTTRKRGLLADEEEISHEQVPFNGEFKLLPPDIPDIKVTHDVPSVIHLKATDLRDIRLVADDVPREIHLLPPKEGLKVSVVPFTMPDINFNKKSLEDVSIPLRLPDLASIKVEFPDKMPKLKVEFPNKMPKIQVEVPESAKIPMFYSGPPIPMEPVKINFIVSPAGSEIDDSLPCVRITPCPRR